MVDPHEQGGDAETLTNPADTGCTNIRRFARGLWRGITWPKRWWRSGDDHRRTANATAILAVTTLALAGVNVGMWVAMQQQHIDFITALQSTEHATRLQLRPYVLFDHGSVEFDSNGAYIANIVFKNPGQSPAYCVQRWFDTKVDDLTDDFVTIRDQLPMGPISKETSTDLGKDILYPLTRKKPITAAEISLVQSTDDVRKAIYVWGEIHFVDISKRGFIERFWARAERPIKDVGEWPLVMIRNETNDSEAPPGSC